MTDSFVSSFSTPDLSDQLARRVLTLLPPLLSAQRSSWEQGSAAQALLECHDFDATAVPHALGYIHGLVHDSVVRQGPDGRLGVMLNGDGSSDAGALDPACIGESFYYLLSLPEEHPHALSRDAAGRLTIGVERMLRYVLNDCPRAVVGNKEDISPSDLLLSHRTDCVQIWSDSVYMLPPFLASAAAFYSRRPSNNYNVSQLVRMSLDQIILAAEALQDTTGAWSHVYDLEKREFKRKAHWGVGNGWVCAGITRVLRIFVSALERDGADTEIGRALTKDADIMAKFQRCYHILIGTLDDCLRHIRSDGLFHDIIDDESSFVETNLSQQLSYTLYRLLFLRRFSLPGTRSQLRLPSLDDERARWETLADLMWKAAVQKTDEWGFVQGVCGSPHFSTPGTAAEGQAWGILMETARIQYLSYEYLFE